MTINCERGESKQVFDFTLDYINLDKLYFKCFPKRLWKKNFEE